MCFDRHVQALSNALCVFILFVSEVKENIPSNMYFYLFAIFKVFILLVFILWIVLL